MDIWFKFDVRKLQEELALKEAQDEIQGRENPSNQDRTVEAQNGRQRQRR